MHGEIVGDGAHDIEHRGVPFRRGAAGNQVDGRIRPLHQLAGFQGDLGVILGVFVAGLPDPVNLVAQAPIFDAVRLRVAVLAPQVGVVRVPGAVAVFHPVGGLLDAARAQVHADVRLRADAAAVFEELVGAEAIGLFGVPGRVEAARAAVLGPHAVLPVIGGDEIAAGPAQDGQAQALHRAQHVLAEALGIGERRAFLVNAAVNAAPQVLDEAAEDHRVHPGNHLFGVDLDPGYVGLLRAQQRARSETRQPRGGGNPGAARGLHGYSFTGAGSTGEIWKAKA